MMPGNRWEHVPRGANSCGRIRSGRKMRRGGAFSTRRKGEFFVDLTLEDVAMKHFFTSESVTEGHPDKVCDQISDAVLDAILAQDPEAHVACECAATTGMVLVMGEISTTAYVPIDQIARQKIIEIGYDRAKYGFDGHSCAILVSVDEQSPDIARGVVRKDAEQGAGDQGMMFGFACDETPEYMPLPISLAHRLTRRLAQVRKDGTLPYLRPDGKSQVTVEYDDDRVVRIDTVVLSTQHAPEFGQKQIEADMLRHVILPILPPELVDDATRYYINPTGRFVIGGPQGDAGLTGRKIIVDTYGGYARHGGGAFSGKDPSKVDRSGAYAMRHVAKNLVAAGLARRCEVGVAYAIGVAEPVSVFVNSYGTGALSDERLAEIVTQCFELRPGAIIRDLDLKRPIYAQTASYGHFGRPELDLPWEKLDKVDALKKAL